MILEDKTAESGDKIVQIVEDDDSFAEDAAKDAGQGEEKLIAEGPGGNDEDTKAGKLGLLDDESDDEREAEQPVKDQTTVVTEGGGQSETSQKLPTPETDLPHH